MVKVNKTTCNGYCEGSGFYPDDDQNNPAWQKAHETEHTVKNAVKTLWENKEFWYWKSVWKDIFNGSFFNCDGWHFVTCSLCDGTGKQ